MPPENILQRLKKIQAMADPNRGTTPDERDTAKILLKQLLNKYDMTIDDLTTPTVERFHFNFFTATEKNLLFQIVAHVTKSSTITWFKTRNTRRIGFELTPIQAALVRDYWETYREPLKKEMKRYIDSLFAAFIHKHNLFNDGPSNGNGNKSQPIDPDLLNSIYHNLGNIRRPLIKIEA